VATLNRRFFCRERDLRLVDFYAMEPVGFRHQTRIDQTLERDARRIRSPVDADRPGRRRSGSEVAPLLFRPFTLLLNP
jgi:hypothetical protein